MGTILVQKAFIVMTVPVDSPAENYSITLLKVYFCTVYSTNILNLPSRIVETNHLELHSLAIYNEKVFITNGIL